MSEDQIRAFLTSHNSYFHQTVADVDSVTFDASSVIYNACVEYQINPQVILATLQKENTGVTTSTRPNNTEMENLMGAGSPTTARQQLQDAANYFRSYQDSQNNGGSTVSGWKVGVAKMTSDGVLVTPATKAVAGQFTYTPYAGAQWTGDLPQWGGVYLFYRYWNQFGFANAPSRNLTVINYVVNSSHGSIKPMDSSSGNGASITAYPADNNGVYGGSGGFTLTYPDQTIVTLTAPPLTNGTVLLGWGGTGGVQTNAPNLQIQLNGDYTITNYYIQSSAAQSLGSIRISIVPQPAADAGAQWQLSTDTIWRSSGTIATNLPFGSYQVQYRTIAGWAAPQSTQVTVTADDPDIWMNSSQYAQQSITRTLTVASCYPNSGVPIGVSPQDNQGNDVGATPFALIYNDLTTVSLTAPLTAGRSTFVKWQIDGFDYSVTTNTSVGMNGDHTVAAIYAYPDQLSGMGIGNGSFAFVLNGPVGSNYVIYESSDLVHWMPFSTNTVPSTGSYFCVDSALGTSPQRFYKAVLTNAAPPPAGPIVSTLPASSVSSSSADINGNVDPNGATTSAYFQYGPTTNYASSTGSLTGITTAESVYFTWSGLLPNSTYHYRIVASNSGGTTYGNDMSFTTSNAAPTVTTLAATSITSSSATLNANVYPNGAATTVYFQWGTTTSYGSSSTPGSIGTQNFTLSYPISGLSPNTPYHFRIVAYNSGGTTYGSDLTFTTSQ